MLVTIALAALGAAKILTRGRGGWILLLIGLGGAALVRPHVSLLVFVAILVAFLVGRRNTRAMPGTISLSGITKALGIVVLLVGGALLAPATAHFLKVDDLTTTSVTNALAHTQAQTAQGNSAFHAINPNSPIGYPHGRVHRAVPPAARRGAHRARACWPRPRPPPCCCWSSWVGVDCWGRSTGCDPRPTSPSPWPTSPCSPTPSRPSPTSASWPANGCRSCPSCSCPLSLPKWHRPGGRTSEAIGNAARPGAPGPTESTAWPTCVARERAGPARLGAGGRVDRHPGLGGGAGGGRPRPARRTTASRRFPPTLEPGIGSSAWPSSSGSSACWWRPVVDGDRATSSAARSTPADELARTHEAWCAHDLRLERALGQAADALDGGRHRLPGHQGTGAGPSRLSRSGPARSSPTSTSSCPAARCARPPRSLAARARRRGGGGRAAARLRRAVRQGDPAAHAGHRRPPRPGWRSISTAPRWPGALGLAIDLDELFDRSGRRWCWAGVGSPPPDRRPRWCWPPTRPRWPTSRPDSAHGATWSSSASVPVEPGTGAAPDRRRERGGPGRAVAGRRRCWPPP